MALATRQAIANPRARAIDEFPNSAQSIVALRRSESYEIESEITRIARHELLDDCCRLLEHLTRSARTMIHWTSLATVEFVEITIHSKEGDEVN